MTKTSPLPPEVELFTTRYRAVHDLRKAGGLQAFQPVRTSIGSPRFIKEAGEWQYVNELAPVGLRTVSEKDRFEEKYRARLDSFGTERIAKRLETIWKWGKGLPLALLCFEDTNASWCHRSMFATWWEEQTGVVIPEAKSLVADRLRVQLNSVKFEQLTLDT